jgi:hypothetical protein
MNRPRRESTIRFPVAGGAAFGLTSLVLRLTGSLSVLTVPFLRCLVAAASVKLLGDLAYFIVSPRRRETTQLDDYLANDFLTFFRFALPLAIFQALVVGSGRVPPALSGLWTGPGLATILYLVNRSLVEQAQDKRRATQGGIPLVGQQRPTS